MNAGRSDRHQLIVRGVIAVLAAVLASRGARALVPGPATSAPRIGAFLALWAVIALAMHLAVRMVTGFMLRERRP